MKLGDLDAQRRFAEERSARLATAGDDGWPHIVPVTFDATAQTVVVAVDHKPKSTQDLRRLRNIRQNRRVALLADRYSEDWAQLWWVRADGAARVVDAGDDRDAALERLIAKYPQYRDLRPTGPVIVVTVERWSGWQSAAAPAAPRSRSAT